MKKIIIVISVLFILLVVVRLSNDNIDGFEDSSKSVIICKADWCGHCKKAAPEFDKLKSASPISLKNGTKATVKILDADQDKSEISKYKVRGYPTILIQNGSDVIEYPGERTHSGVLDFLNSL
jgi:thiol-disulfide isomerase/thioredoxin